MVSGLPEFGGFADEEHMKEIARNTVEEMGVDSILLAMISI